MGTFLNRNPIRVQCSLLVALAAAFICVPTAGARAEFHFSSPRTLSVVEAAGAQVAVDPQGRATVVWNALGPEETVLIQVVRLDAFGLPGPIQALDQVPKHPLPYCTCPQVAVDPFGRATVTWQSYDGKNRRIKAAQIDASEAVGPVYTLSKSGSDAWNSQLAVDSQGRVTVVWRYPSAGDVQSVRLGTDGLPAEAKTLAETTTSGPPEVAVGPQGIATAVWPSTEGLRTVQLDGSGTPGPVQPIPSTSNDDGVVEVVVDSKGRATIAWWRGLGAYEAKSVRLDPAGTPGTVQDLSPPGQDTYEPLLAVDPQDRVTAVWQDFDDHVHATQLGEDGIPGTVHTLSGEESAGAPQVAARPGGGAVVVWTHPGIPFAPDEECLPVQFDPEGDVVKAAFLDPDGQPEQTEAISPYAEQSLRADVAIDPLDRPTVAWESYDGTYFCEDWDTRVQVSRGTVATTIPPEPEPAPPVPPELPAPPGVSLLRLGGRASVEGRHLLLRVRCPQGADGACAGEVKLARRAFVVARGHYRLLPGGRKTIRLPLTRYGKALAKRGSGTLLLTTGKGRGVETGVVWVRLPRHPL
jgi:hypothetical protein